MGGQDELLGVRKSAAISGGRSSPGSPRCPHHPFNTAVKTMGTCAVRRGVSNRAAVALVKGLSIPSFAPEHRHELGLVRASRSVHLLFRPISGGRSYPQRPQFPGCPRP